MLCDRSILLKAQISISETHDYATFDWQECLSTFPVIKGKSPKLVGSTQEQEPKGRGVRSSLQSAHQAACPAGEALGATRQKGAPIPNSHKGAVGPVAWDRLEEEPVVRQLRLA